MLGQLCSFLEIMQTLQFDSAVHKMKRTGNSFPFDDFSDIRSKICQCLELLSVSHGHVSHPGSNEDTDPSDHYVGRSSRENKFKVRKQNFHILPTRTLLINNFLEFFINESHFNNTQTVFYPANEWFHLKVLSQGKNFV